MSSRIDKDMVRSLAEGHWLEILPALAPGRFDAAIAHLGRKVTCPFHGGENDFRFALKPEGKEKRTTAESGRAFCSCGPYVDGFAVLMRANGWTFNEAVRNVYDWLRGADITTPMAPAPVERTLSQEEIDAIRDSAVKLWNAGWSFNQQKVPYYQARGLGALSGVQDTRFLPRLGYFELENRKAVKKGEYPAMLVLVRDKDEQVCGIHRTYLTSERNGKAPVVEPKKMTRSINMDNGAAARIYAAAHSEVLGLTEGIENGHAVRELVSSGYFDDLSGKLPVWAALSETGIRTFKIPASLPKLKKLIIFCDNDASGVGLNAAKKLIEILREERPDLEVEFRCPPRTGDDWLDVNCEFKASRLAVAA